MQLFCIPFSGGNAYSYAEFKKYLPDHIELCNLELPGRGTRIREPLLTDIDTMTEDLFRQMEDHIQGDYAIFGHSLGALLTITLSRMIQEKGMNPPSHLFLSGQSTKDFNNPNARYLLPDDQFIQMLRNMEGTPEELLTDESFVNFFLPIIRADFQSIETYKNIPAPFKLKMPITVLLGKEEPVTDEEAALWQMETDNTFSIHRFEGGHFFIYNQTAEICRFIAEKCSQPV